MYESCVYALSLLFVKVIQVELALFIFELKDFIESLLRVCRWYKYGTSAVLFNRYIMVFLCYSNC